ncbi:unnamed protein product [Mytilus edulis]|uniref:HMG box domain-containing protein n=1 Tax=Mytilus edulis TaxID=6550 RepID=A0A8S3RJQ2_MYTED|nr:unnamed protein product [Mytilus edulis]
MSCKCVDNTDILLQILDELKKHTKYYEEKEKEPSPAKKNPTGQKKSTLTQRAQELYIKNRASKEDGEDGGGDAAHEHYLKKWKSLSEEKKNKWKKKAEKVAQDVAKASAKTTAPLIKKPTKTSAFQVFTSQNLHKMKGKINNNDAMRQNGEDWKNVSEGEKEKYAEEAQRNVSGASSGPLKSKNKLRDVKSDPGEEDDDDELSDKYEFLSTSTPIHSSKVSDKLQPASKLKEKVKSTIESLKIITPKKKLKRPLESNEEHGKNTPQSKKKKVAPSPVKKVKKESSESSSSESDSEEATTKTKKSPSATVKQSDINSKKIEKKIRRLK